MVVMTGGAPNLGKAAMKIKSVANTEDEYENNPPQNQNKLVAITAWDHFSFAYPSVSRVKVDHPLFIEHFCWELHVLDVFYIGHAH